MDLWHKASQLQESGGKDYNSDGSVVTSPKGAQGINQVLSSTNYNPGYGVTPAKDNSLAERARVGNDYREAMFKRYGNPAQGLAAYNAGPGTVDNALKKAQATGGDWSSYLPSETKQYIQKVGANYVKLQNGGGGFPSVGQPGQSSASGLTPMQMKVGLGVDSNALRNEQLGAIEKAVTASSEGADENARTSNSRNTMSMVQALLRNNPGLKDEDPGSIAAYAKQLRLAADKTNESHWYSPGTWTTPKNDYTTVPEFTMDESGNVSDKTTGAPIPSWVVNHSTTGFRSAVNSALGVKEGLYDKGVAEQEARSAGGRPSATPTLTAGQNTGPGRIVNGRGGQAYVINPSRATGGGAEKRITLAEAKTRGYIQ